MSGFAAFDAEMFPDRVSFAAPGDGGQRSGGVVPGFGVQSGQVPAYVELQTGQASEVDAHQIPEGRELYAVFTPAQPPAGVNRMWRIAWGAQNLSVLAVPKPQAGGLLWRTWAVDVS